MGQDKDSPCILSDNQETHRMLAKIAYVPNNQVDKDRTSTQMGENYHMTELALVVTRTAIWRQEPLKISD